MSIAVPSLEAAKPTHPTSAASANLMPDFTRLNDAPAWFQNRAKAAWDEFQSLALPGLKDEAWRYSGAKRLALDALHTAAGPGEAEKALAMAQSHGLEKTSAKFIFLNDALVHSDTAALPQGVICLPFADALKSQADILEQYLMRRPAQLGSKKFAALHLAHLRAGVVILAPKNAVLEHPIEIFHWTSGEGALAFPHTLIVTGDHAQVTVVDHHGSLRDESAASIAVADFVAGPGSRITYVNAQELSLKSRALHISSTTVGRDASVKALQLHLGGAFSRNETVSDLVGEGARSEMLGVSLPFGDQCVDMRTLQNHIAPRTFSDLLYKNALYDQSKTVFAGLIQVEEGAHYTDAYQKCRNLLNSDEAEAASMPGLEINADQVKCSHGATSAPISADELFYLKARGIADREARRLIATGFIEDVIAKLENEALVRHLDDLIEAKFARMN
jgi:Fe-S cluster assembly protein SufD